MQENNISIAVINRSTVLSDADVQVIVAGLEIQVKRDFCPVWGQDVDLGFCGLNDLPPEDKWWLVILDDTTMAGALGFHDITSTGLPLGKVFAKTDLDNGLSVSITASHELLEMLVDPEINTTIFDMDSATTGTMYALEVCDPCEDDQFGYEVETDGGHRVRVSDFITPLYYIHGLPAGTKYDFLGKVTEPLQLLSGGYYSTFQVGKGSGWQQVNAAHVPAAKLQPTQGSRRERRARGGRRKWIASVVEVA